MSWVEVDGPGWRWVHGSVIPIYYYLKSFTTICRYIMTQNPNDNITMETLENQITLETLDHLIINAIKEIRYSKKKRPDENSIFEYLNKTLENPDLNKQYIESRLSSMIVDGKLEKKCTNGQTSFYIKKLENELSRKTDASILTQKSPSPIYVKHRHS